MLDSHIIDRKISNGSIYIKLSNHGFSIYRKALLTIDNAVELIGNMSILDLKDEKLYPIYKELFFLLRREMVFDDVLYFKSRQEYYGPGGSKPQIPDKIIGSISGRLINSLPQSYNLKMYELYVQEVDKTYTKPEYMNYSQSTPKSTLVFNIYTSDGFIHRYTRHYYDGAGMRTLSKDEFLKYDKEGTSILAFKGYLPIYNKNITSDYMEQVNLIDSFPIYKKNIYRNSISKEGNIIMNMARVINRIAKNQEALEAVVNKLIQAK